jgi:hypothetical protein
MTIKKRKALIKKTAQVWADNAIGFVKSYPCCICSNELPDHSCWVGYKNKGACPIYKNLQRRLNILDEFE